VTTDLFAAYGESYPSDSRLAGVPFVQSIPLAGGQELLSCDSLDRRIGINLDIAHFRMANISVQQVERFPELLSRIKHSHISGHHRSAHFGDISLMALNDPSDFVPWLQLLDSIRKSQKDFSGVVSLELEAVKSKDDVESAIGELLDLLRGTY
jgi:sugar phosphate isomerase/epimerase